MDAEPLEYRCFECGRVVRLEADNIHIEPHSTPPDSFGVAERCPASWRMVPPPNMSGPAWTQPGIAARRLDSAIRLHDAEVVDSNL